VWFYVDNIGSNLSFKHDLRNLWRQIKGKIKIFFKKIFSFKYKSRLLCLKQKSHGSYVWNTRAGSSIRGKTVVLKLAQRYLFRALIMKEVLCVCVCVFERRRKKKHLCVFIFMDFTRSWCADLSVIIRLEMDMTARMIDSHLRLATLLSSTYLRSF
jgi:hypothetical protein